MRARDLLTRMFAAAVNAADPLDGMRRHLPEAPANGRTVVIGAGKGAAQMAAALERLWAADRADAPLSGVVVTGYGYSCATRCIEVLEAAHPVPDLAGDTACKRIVESIAALTEDDLVIALICGGGSALLPAPPKELTLADEIALNDVLLASGTPIAAMNVVRKCASTVKGGRLAASTKAKVVSFVVSDIPGDNPALIASGPTIPDRTTRADALAIIEQYRLALPERVIQYLQSSDAEAPFPDNPVFAKDEHYIVASAGLSLQAAANVARADGFAAHIISDSIEGEARDVASVHAAIAREVAVRDRPFEKPVVLLSGGETTVTLHGKGGKGGRNSEFALAFALGVDGHDIVALAADTDGIDGSGSNAGAFVDGGTVRRIRAAGADAKNLLADHNSYDAFAALGDLFETGPTGTNVNDFRAILIR